MFAFADSISEYILALAFANAWHFPPLIYRQSENLFIELKTNGMPLGWFKNTRIEEKEIQLEPQDRVILFTDGITETADSDGVQWGDENCDLSPENFSKSLLVALKNFTGSEKFDDDLCLIVLDIL